MSVVRTLLKVVGKTAKYSCLLLVAFVAVLLLLLTVAACQPFTPDDYVTTVKTGAPIETKYLADGPYDVAYAEYDTDEAWKKYVVHYPAAIADGDETFPVVVFVNGTGVFASKYPALFKHLASWGFIVVGNEDPSTFSGRSADMTLATILAENENEKSVFYHKVDTEHVGISGHSQGGVGVFNATQDQEHSAMYTAAVSLSPTQEDWAAALRIPYDPTKTTTPILVLAGTEKDVITLDGMKSLFEKIPCERVLARRKKANHGQMLYSADGYATAWFMWKLKDDHDAANAFVGDAPELETNKLYSDFMSAE